jgi:hypothetical protein
MSVSPLSRVAHAELSSAPCNEPAPFSVGFAVASKPPEGSVVSSPQESDTIPTRQEAMTDGRRRLMSNLDGDLCSSEFLYGLEDEAATSL